MLVWNCYSETLYFILLLIMVTSQQSIEDNSNFRRTFHNGKFDEAESSKTSKNDQTKKSISPQNLDQVDMYEEDSQTKFQHPKLMSEIVAQLQDNDGIEENKYYGQHQKRQNSELDKLIQQTFSGTGEQEYEKPTMSDGQHSQSELKRGSVNGLPESDPYEKVIFKGPLPERSILKRKLLFKQFRPPMFRNGQPNTNAISEQNSEELLHNILESIDQEKSEHGHPIKHAFLTKTTTYNISKLHEDTKNRSFLIEKLVNYSTNINMLHPDNIPTNYSDTHSSVLQTVLNLGQLEKNTDGLERNDKNVKPSYRSFVNDNNISKEIIGSKALSDISVESKLNELPQTHEAPTEFLGGQYLQHPNKPYNIISKQSYKNNNEQTPSDFVGGQFIGNGNKEDNYSHSLESKDRNNNLLEFVGGQFVGQPLKSDENIGRSSHRFETNSENFVVHQTTTEENATPSTITNEMPTHSPYFDIPSLSLTDELVGDIDNKNSSIIDSNSNPQENNPNPLISILKPSMTQSNDSRSFTDDILDKERQKNIQAPLPKPLDGNNISPGKALGEGTLMNKPTNGIESNQKTDVSDSSNEKILKETLESTANTYDDSFFNDLTITSEIPEAKKPSFSWTKNAVLQSEKVPEGAAQQSSHESPQNSSNFRNKDTFPRLGMTNQDNYNYNEVTVEEQSASTTEKNEQLSRENEDYDNSKAFVGLKPTNSFKDIFGSDSVTGNINSKEINRYNPNDFTSETDDYKDVESVSTFQPISESEYLLSEYDKGLDHVVGEASDIRQSKFGSVNTEKPNRLSSENPLFQEQDITGLVDDVQLYAGKDTTGEGPEYQTTQSYNSGDIYKNSLGIVRSDTSDENTTEICIPLTKENYPTLLDLLSGKLYLEKDGKRMNLKMKGNPMKYCNSGTKICKLFFDLQKNSEPSISEEMFEIADDNAITKDSGPKSKNGKRDINKEYADFMKPEQNVEQNILNNDEKTTVRETIEEPTNENEGVILLTVNKSAANHNILNFNQTDKSEFKNLQRKVESPPIQSLFIQIPVSHKTQSSGVQRTSKEANDNEHNNDPQSNGEKITLYSLDSPYHKLGFPKGNRLARKVHQKRHLGGACGCNNPLLLSPNPIPDYRHFVGKRLAILTNIVHTVKDWAAEDSLRP